MHKVGQKPDRSTEVKFCTRCVISNQRPRMVFDKEGVCGACLYSDKKKTIDWKKREEELVELCNKHRKNDGSFDVIVPASGGKDSSYVAHQLKHVYGMHPLTVTWSPHTYPDIGRQNFQSFIDSGFDNILGTPDGNIHRKLTRLAFEELGDPFQPFIYGQKAFPIRIATTFNIPLVMYGEHAELEYSGNSKIGDLPGHKVTDEYMLENYFSGIEPMYWKKHGFSDKDLYYYTTPSSEHMIKVGVECNFFGYYKKWVPQENFYYAQKHCNFLANPDGRSEGTYSKYASLDDRIDGFHYYLGFIKFGIGRATSDAAHEIRDGHILREEGIALVKRYDGEFPKNNFAEFLKYTNINENRFWEIVDGFRPPHLWEQKDNAWKLKYRIG